MKYMLAAGAAVFTTLVATPLAYASPLDPHVPDMTRAHCPGGSGGSAPTGHWCDGEHYPDGTYWHQDFWEGWPERNALTCVIDNGSFPPPPAPPGGCGGTA